MSIAIEGVRHPRPETRCLGALRAPLESAQDQIHQQGIFHRHTVLHRHDEEREH